MQVNSIEDFVKGLKGLSEEQTKKAVGQYVNMRVQKATEDAWKNIRKVWRYKEQKTRNKFRKVGVEMDEFTGMISLAAFTRYITAIEDLAEKLAESSCDETRDALGDIQDALYQHIKSIKIDKRINYSNSD